MKEKINGLGGSKSSLALIAVILFIILLISLAANSTLSVTYGDVNFDGRIDVRDAVLVMKHVINISFLTAAQQEAADVNGDGDIDIKDVNLIMQKAIGLIDKFPVPIVSVEQVNITVPTGTSYSGISFPSTVKATLRDQTTRNIQVSWAQTSTPTYNPFAPGNYEFKGELVNLPGGVGNPTRIAAKAVVMVWAQWVPDPTPTPLYTVTFNETNGRDDVTIRVYSDSARTITVGAALITDTSGQAYINLPNGTYYYRASKTGFNDFPGQFTVSNAARTESFTMAATPALTTINIAPIPGVTEPVTSGTPVGVITATTQYTGTVSWSPAHAVFQEDEIYTATITLAPTAGYTLTGVTANFFTVAGATSVSNTANSGVVTAVFPATAAPQTVTLLDIPGVTAPVTGMDQDKTLIDTAQYTGTITWSPGHEPFEPLEIYTAIIVLTAKPGWTFVGVAANSFDVSGATTVTNAVDSGVVMAEFPETLVPPAPDIVSAVIAPDNTLTITFDMETNVPAVEDKDDIDALITFGAVLGADYTGSWTDASTLVITVVDDTGRVFTTGNSLAIKATGNLRNAAGTSNQSTAWAVVSGTWIPGPLFDSATTNAAGTRIIITFDKVMDDPAGEHEAFTFKVNGVDRGFTAAILGTNETRIRLVVDGDPIENDDTVTVSYDAATGSVVAADSTVLESFTDKPVANIVPTP